MSFTTPLPPPQILRQYDEIIPSFSNDLHKEVFKETTHRRSLDNWLVKGGTIRAVIGQVFAFVIAMFGLYIAWSLGMAGFTLAAGIIAAVDLVGLVSVFLGQSYFNAKNQDAEKTDENRKDE